MKRKKWCRHTRIMKPGVDWDKGDYSFTDEAGWIDWNINTDRWNFCPICGKPRPKNVESV